MLSAKDLALVKALAAKLSPALINELKSSPALKELRSAVNDERKNRPAVPVGKRSSESSASSHRFQHQRVGGREPTELNVSGDSSEPAAKRPSPDGLRATARALLESHGRTSRD
jgi:beta-phosphoglucomutase-like phosphatase (HAD superfamily)